MSRRKPTSAGSRNYAVGYGQPPSERRFKPGQSGNPKGRPKGRKSNSTLLRELLDRKVAITVEGQRRKLSVREVIFTRFAEAALKGDIKSASFLLQRDDVTDDVAPQTDTPLSEDEREIIDAYLKMHKQKDH